MPTHFRSASPVFIYPDGYSPWSLLRIAYAAVGCGTSIVSCSRAGIIRRDLVVRATGIILRVRGMRSMSGMMRWLMWMSWRRNRPALHAWHSHARRVCMRRMRRCHRSLHTAPASYHASCNNDSASSSRSMACMLTGAGASPPCGFPPLPGSPSLYSWRVSRCRRCMLWLSWWRTFA